MENSAKAWNIGTKLLRNCQNSGQNSSCIGGRHIVCTRPNRLMNNWLAMWGYICLTDLYILAKQIFVWMWISFFWTQKKGYMRSLLGRRGGAWESNTFFLWPYLFFLDLNYFLMLEIFFVVVSKLDRCLSNNVMNEYIQWSFLVEIIVDNL